MFAIFPKAAYSLRTATAERSGCNMRCKWISMSHRAYASATVVTSSNAFQSFPRFKAWRTKSRALSNSLQESSSGVSVFIQSSPEISRRTTHWSRPRQWQLSGLRVPSRARRLTAGVCAVHAVMLGSESLLSRYSWSRRTREAQGRHREVGSEGSVERTCGARDTNRIRGVVQSGRAGTQQQSPPSTIGLCFIHPASMHGRYDS